VKPDRHVVTLGYLGSVSFVVRWRACLPETGDWTIAGPLHICISIHRQIRARRKTRDAIKPLLSLPLFLSLPLSLSFSLSLAVLCGVDGWVIPRSLGSCATHTRCTSATTPAPYSSSSYTAVRSSAVSPALSLGCVEDPGCLPLNFYDQTASARDAAESHHRDPIQCFAIIEIPRASRRQMRSVGAGWVDVGTLHWKILLQAGDRLGHAFLP
jgi:hypothetical protein